MTAAATLMAVAPGLAAAPAWSVNAAPAAEPPLPTITAERCPGNPLISPEMDAGIGDNINGPAPIRTPAWLPGRLGRYYLYFASHRGRSIRLAYADAPCGPWTVHPPGTLQLAQAQGFVDHIASPDAHVDEERREIRLYVHGRKAGGLGVQRTGLAVSADGLSFRMVERDLGSPYFRVFPWGGAWFALAKQANAGGRLYRAPTPRGPFTPVAALLPRMRHAAVLPWRDRLLVFHSRIGDAPERIVVTSLQLDREGGDPRLLGNADVLTPATAAEGADLPVGRSRSGATRRAHQLRDPAVLIDGERVFLFYALAGESGIGAAALKLSP
jgi:hypothetical protein